MPLKYQLLPELKIFLTKIDKEVSFFRVSRQALHSFFWTFFGLNYNFVNVCFLICKAEKIPEFAGRLFMNPLGSLGSLAILS